MPFEVPDSALTTRTSLHHADSASDLNLVEIMRSAKQSDAKESERSNTNNQENSKPTVGTLAASESQRLLSPSVQREVKTPVVNSETVVASAKAIRSATYRDSWIYAGTDEEKIFKVLGSLTEAERAKLKTVYKDTYGITLENELKREMSGSQLDKSMNLLNKKDGSADDAGFVHELITELNQMIVGRTRGTIGRTLREKLSSMSFDEIQTLDREYKQRYGTSAQKALLQQVRLDGATKDAFKVYFKGREKTNDEDALKLADSALKKHDLTMFREAMVLSSPQGRREFAEKKGEKALSKAFLLDPAQIAKDAAVVIGEGLWTVLDTPQSLQNYNYAKDYMTYGKLSAITQIKDASGIIDDNEGAIESALKTMSEQERSLYKTGQTLAKNGNTTELSPDQKKALSYHEDLNGAIKAAGNATEILRWQDMAMTKGGTMVSDLARHRGMLYNDGAGKVLSGIEKMSKEDWNHLKKEPDVFSKQIESMLKTIISAKDVQRAMTIIEQKARAASYEESLKSGQRAVGSALWDSVGMWGNDHEAAIKSLLNMTVEEQKRYRDDADFRGALGREVLVTLGSGTPAQKAAEHILKAVSDGKVPQNDIIVRLYMYGAMWDADDAEVLREVEKEFKNDPAMLDRINHPKTADDRMFGKEMENSLKLAIGSFDFPKYGVKLLRDGFVGVDDRAYLSRGYVYDERESMIKSILASNEADKKLLLSEDKKDPVAMRLQKSVFGQLTDDQAQFARALLKQGELRPEDSVRSFVVGAGAKSSVVMDILTKLPTAEQSKMRDAYASKYGANMVADLNYWLGSGEKEMLSGLIKTEGRGTADVFNEHLDQYSHSRDGFGQWFVDNLWDDTGFQAEEAVGDYTKALSLSAQTGEQLQESRQMEITDQIAQSLSRFKNSKLAAGEAAANAGITGLAVAAAPFTAGTSLSLLAKIAIAGTAGAVIKVATKAAISGNDYELSAKRLSVDGGTGFVSGAISMIGTNELASLFGLGGKVGSQAAVIATSSLGQMGTESGQMLLKEGSQEVIEKCLTAWVRQAMLSGSEKVNEQAIVMLAQHVAVEGNEAVVQLAIQQSLNAAIKEVTAHTVANLTVQLGLPTVNGGFAGALNGTISGAAEWDSRLPAGKNVENIAVSAGVNGAVGAGTSFTVAAGMKSATFTYEQLKAISANTEADLPAELKGLNKNAEDLGPAKSLVGADDQLGAAAKTASGADPAGLPAKTPQEVGPIASAGGSIQASDLNSVAEEVLNETLDTPVLTYKKFQPVRAVQSSEPFTWINSKGEAMHASAGDWKITQPDGKISSIKPDIFKQSYEPTSTALGEYRKSAITAAQRVDRPISIVTPEGPSKGKVGDYMVTGVQGEKYFVPGDKFESMYKAVDNVDSPVFPYKTVESVKVVQNTISTPQGSKAGNYYAMRDGNFSQPIDPLDFRNSYRPVSGSENYYVGLAKAQKIVRPLNVLTTSDGVVAANPGDYIVTNAQGKTVMSADQFQLKYQLDADDLSSTPLSLFRKGQMVSGEPSAEPFKWLTPSGYPVDAKTGDYRVVSTTGDVSSLSPDVFNEKFEPSFTKPGQFQRTSYITAKKLLDATTLILRKGPTNVAAGDYVVSGVNGEDFVVPGAKFDSMFRPVNEQPATAMNWYQKFQPIKAEVSQNGFSWVNSNGNLMHAAAGDYKVIQPDGKVSSIKPDIFQKSYTAVPGSPGEFVKSATTTAQKIEHPMAVLTPEGVGKGNTGDYLVTGVNGEQYFVPGEKFESMYKRIGINEETNSRILKLKDDDGSLFANFYSKARNPEQHIDAADMKKLVQRGLMNQDGEIDDLARKLILEDIKKGGDVTSFGIIKRMPELYDWGEWAF